MRDGGPGGAGDSITVALDLTFFGNPASTAQEFVNFLSFLTGVPNTPLGALVPFLQLEGGNVSVF